MMPFWALTWLTGQRTQLMSAAERGGYIDLVANCWIDENCSLPADMDDLRRLARMTEQEWSAADRLRASFIPHPTVEGRLTHDFVWQLNQSDLEYRRKQAKKGRESARAKRQQRLNRGSTGSQPSSPSPSPSPSPLNTPLPPKGGVAKKSRKPRASTADPALDPYRRLQQAYEQEQHEAWGITGASFGLGKINCAHLDFALKGRTMEQAEELVRAYVRLRDPFLEQEGHPIRLLPDRLPKLLSNSATSAPLDPTWKIPPRLT